MSFPKPSKSQILAALDAHEVTYNVESITASSEGRPWNSGLRAIVDHHTAGTNSLGYMKNTGGSSPYVNALFARSGHVHILSTKSCWGSGDGGPWSGIASKDSLHLVGWQNEVEDLGQAQTFTAAQLESLGRVNAALVSLGVPAGNEINHKDWTDGNAPVGGYPLPTKGRKIDTRYAASFLRENTAKYLGGSDVPLSQEDIDKVAKAVWNLKLSSRWSGSTETAASMASSAQFYSIQAGLIGKSPTAGSGAGADTTAKIINDNIDSIPGGGEPGEPGEPGNLTDADLNAIAERVAEIFADRLGIG